jgi:hypothetical protein
MLAVSTVAFQRRTPDSYASAVLVSGVKFSRRTFFKQYSVQNFLKRMQPLRLLAYS